MSALDPVQDHQTNFKSDMAKVYTVQPIAYIMAYHIR